MTPLQRRSEMPFLDWMTCFRGGGEREGGLPVCAVPSDTTGLPSVGGMRRTLPLRGARASSPISVSSAPLLMFIFHCKYFPQIQTVRGKLSCQQDSLVG